jgi:hypothetical protein
MAQVSLSAQVPAPMTGVSPTRPGDFAVMPPVDVAAARLPFRSRATAPTVPCLRDSSWSSWPLRRMASVS